MDAKCTDQEFIDLWNDLRSPTALARYLNADVRTVFRRRRSIENRMGIKLATKPDSDALRVMQGDSPQHGLTHPIPEPLTMRGTSTLYDEAGNQKLQWVKTKLDDAKVRAAMLAAVDALTSELPRESPAKPPKHAAKELCTLYTVTDCHIGMRAWAPETGQDWDLEIAERVLTAAVDYLMAAAPPSAVGIINELGDFLHFDSLSPVTPTSGYQLDADSRFSKVVQVATRILRHMVREALKKHEHVVVFIEEGNHDMASSVWLRHLFSLLFENDPRVQVMQTENPYNIYMHGKTMLAFHHGHLQKFDRLPMLFAAQFPTEWGFASKRYCHIGHFHHLQEREDGGMKVTQHPTLAARDAYAARGGWAAERQITAITYHAEFGQVASVTVTPEMIGG